VPSAPRLTAWRALLPALLFLALSTGADAQQRQLDPATVRAAFVLNFAEYVRWPGDAFPSEDAPLVVAVTPGSDYEAFFRALHGNPSGSRRLRVVSWAPGSSLPACHILVALDPWESIPQEAIRLSAGRPILVVSEIPGLAEAGSMINFTPRGSRLGFEVNPTAAEVRGLTISSHLLRLGTVIGGPPRSTERR
jgi:hypothetical protein